MTISIRGKIISLRHSAFDIFETSVRPLDSVIEWACGTGRYLEAFQMRSIGVDL